MNALFIAGFALAQAAGTQATPPMGGGQAPELDIHQMSLTRPGLVRAGTGFTDTATGRELTLAQVAQMARGKRFVLVGEQHDDAAHHQTQADVIRALREDGRWVSVGLEMFTRDNQANMFPWTTGRWSEAEFIERAQWKTQWGFDYAIYRPIFEEVRQYRMPMFALNVPRQWIREVGRQGPAVLDTPERRAWVPPLDLTHAGHQSLFWGMMGGHPSGADQTRAQNTYAAMVAWDTGMARSAIDAMATRTSPRHTMVIIAGNGHAYHDLGINLRLRQQGESEIFTIICLPKGAPSEVSRGIGDVVWRAP